MTRKNIWEEYFKILNGGCNEELQKLKADLYISTYCPRYLYKYFSIPKKICDKKKRFKQLKDELLWLSTKDNLNDPFELMMAKTNFSNDEHFYQDYLKEVTNNIVLLCLTTKPTDSLMWSHYANSHKGFCVKFKVGSFVAFPIQYISKPKDYTKLYKDFYDNKDALINQMDKTKIKYANNIELMNYLKQKCWSYEEEFRIIRHKKENDANGSLYAAKDLGLEIAEIICGLNCSSKDIQSLKKICDSINNRREREKRKMIAKSLQDENVLNVIKKKNPKLTKKQITQIAYKSNSILPLVKFSKVEYTPNFKLTVKNYES